MLGFHLLWNKFVVLLLFGAWPIESKIAICAWSRNQNLFSIAFCHLSGLRGENVNPVYCASKHGVVGISRSMAVSSVVLLCLCISCRAARRGENSCLQRLKAWSCGDMQEFGREWRDSSTIPLIRVLYKCVFICVCVCICTLCVHVPWFP